MGLALSLVVLLSEILIIMILKVLFMEKGELHLLIDASVGVVKMLKSVLLNLLIRI